MLSRRRRLERIQGNALWVAWFREHNWKPAFPIFSPVNQPVVVTSISPRIKHRSKLARVGRARLYHRDSEVISLWCPRGCTHSPASPFLAEKPLIS